MSTMRGNELCGNFHYKFVYVTLPFLAELSTNNATQSKESFQTSSFFVLELELTALQNNRLVVVLVVLYWYKLNQIPLNMTVKDESDPVNQLLDKVRPHVAKLTFGSIVGYCSGAAAKKIGRALAVICGLGFIAIQSGEL